MYPTYPTEVSQAGFNWGESHRIYNPGALVGDSAPGLCWQIHEDDQQLIAKGQAAS